MPFQIISQTITGNASATFDFSTYNAGTIGAFVYGFSAFNMVNGSPGAPLQNFGMTYVVAVGTGVGYSTVTLTQTLQNGLDPSSSATIAVIAFLGASNPPGINFGVQKSLAIGETGTAYSPEYPPALAASVLSGFALNFGDDNSDLVGLGAGAGLVTVPGSTAMVPVADGALLGDASYSGSADVGTLILDSSQTGIVFATAQTVIPSQAIANPFPSNITNWVFLIQSFYAQFDVDYDPSPDLISLQVSGVATLSGSSTATVSLIGQARSNSRYAPPPQNATVTNTVAFFILVGVPD